MQSECLSIYSSIDRRVNDPRDHHNTATTTVWNVILTCFYYRHFILCREWFESPLRTLVDRPDHRIHPPHYHQMIRWVPTISFEHYLSCHKIGKGFYFNWFIFRRKWLIILIIHLRNYIKDISVITSFNLNSPLWIKKQFGEQIQFDHSLYRLVFPCTDDHFPLQSSWLHSFIH